MVSMSKLLWNRGGERLMPDITICVNKKCKKRNICYRYVAEPSLFQSYDIFNVDCSGDCFYFIEIRHGGGV